MHQNHDLNSDELRTQQIFLGAGLTGHPKPRIGHVEKYTVILLLHVGYHIKHRVHVVRCGCHGQACDSAHCAVDENVVWWKRHVHAREHECYCGCDDWD